MRWLPLLALSGCASMGALQTADTLGTGNIQLAVEVSEQAQIGRDSLTAYPMAGTSARIGVTPWLDLGARFGPSGGELQPKIRISPATVPVFVSLAPSAGISILDNSGVVLRFYNFALPVLVGVPIGNGHQLVFTARFNDTLAYESAGSARGLLNLMVGSFSVGFAARLWRFRIMPEVAVGFPLWTTADRSDIEGGATFGAGRTMVQGNLTLLYGGPGQ